MGAINKTNRLPRGPYNTVFIVMVSAPSFTAPNTHTPNTHLSNDISIMLKGGKTNY